jgi:hypothetical protein
LAFAGQCRWKLYARYKTPASITKPDLYEDLHKKGQSKEKAARISNAAAARGTSRVAKKAGALGRMTIGLSLICASGQSS